MAKQTLGQGDSNVVVRNQVVYGALPQDVIDRMGDTTLALQTTEQNVLPAINELKSNLTDKKMTEILSMKTSIPTTATSYNLSDSLANYDAILFTFYYSGNLIKTATIPLDYFLTTTSSGRVQIPIHTSDGTYQGTINSYHNTNTSLYLQSRNNTTATSNFGVTIHGIKY